MWKINSKIRDGRITRAQAEQEARGAGLVFGELPDPTFDPDAYTDWTPLQAIAWIAARDRGRVRDVSSEPRRRTVVWSESADVIQSLGAPSMDLLADIAPAAERARSELWSRLRAGEINASGVDAPGASRVQISALAWSDLSLYLDDIIFLGDVFVSDAHAYFRVRIDRNAIVSIWPANVAMPTHANVGAVIRDAFTQKGARLTVRELDEIRAKKCAVISRKEFRELAKNMQGHRGPGRPSKN